MKSNKFIAILCAISMLFSLTSCSNKQNEENKFSSEITGSSTEIIQKEESEHKENSFTEEDVKAFIENSFDLSLNTKTWWIER